MKLTKKHIECLNSIIENQHVDICTSVGRSFGKTCFSNGLDARNIISSINTFYSWGWLNHFELSVFGLRWERLKINEKGKQALLNAEVDSE
jgi:hypothetical protein